MSLKILLVDDEQMVLDITKRKLAEEGFLVLTASNGEQAIEVLEDGLVDLILLDVEMPRMNGYTFITERNKIDGAAEIPVIILTAYDSMEPIFKRNNVSEYLTKPIPFQALLTKIKEVLSNSIVKLEEAEV